MFDLSALANSVFQSIAGTPEEKAHAQEQLRPVLERRFEPCLELWKDLWQFAEDAREGIQNGRVDDKVERLGQRVQEFLHENGALVSYPGLRALIQFRDTLREFKAGEDELIHRGRVLRLFEQIFPFDEKNKKGEVTGTSPGLLLLLRDELGSNASAVSSVATGFARKR